MEMRNGKELVYISGPMKGLPDLNIPAFKAAAESLRSLGYEVICPPELNEIHEEDYYWYVRRDVMELIHDDVDCMVMLEGWEKSGGANLEVTLANFFNIPMKRLVDGPPHLVPYEENVLEEAERLVYGNRQADYGHPLDDFSKTAKIWSAILGVDVTPEQVALCMVGVKISRQVNRPKRDNIVDGAGYWATLELVINERERREKENGKKDTQTE
jgi:hypothetical protein